MTLCELQEGEDGKEEEEKEFFGKLEYSLDYSFTDNQVGALTRPHQNLGNQHLFK